MKRTYKAVLFHPEGDHVTDFEQRKNIDQVWDELNNMGSRWFFYPLYFVASNKNRIVDTPEGMEFLKYKSVQTVRNYLAERWQDNKEEICEVINEGGPIGLIYY